MLHLENEQLGNGLEFVLVNFLTLKSGGFKI